MSGYPYCPPPTPQPCPQVCSPPPPPTPCRPKPIMRGLHMAYAKRGTVMAILCGIMAGTSYYLFVGAPRIEKYKKFYEKAELDDWCDEMARKGLFEAVPKELLKDNQHMKK